MTAPAVPSFVDPVGGGMSGFLTTVTLLLGLLALVALARLVAGEELFTGLRWRH